MTTEAETMMRPADQQPLAPPMLVAVGDRFMVCASGKPNLPEDMWRELMLAAAGEGDVQAAIGRAEAFMEIREYHRIEALHRAGTLSDDDAEARRDPIRLAVLENERAKDLAELSHVLALGAPLRDPVIVAEIEEARAGAADARAEAAQLRDEDPKRHRKKIKNLEAIARSLDAKAEAARLRELEENRKMGAARETVLRARARGQEVKVEEVETATVVRDEHGARVTHKRGSKRGEPVLKYELISRPEIVTAIMHALDAGKLDNPRTGQGGDGLKKIADQYAEMAAASNHLRCVDPEATGGGGGTGGGPQIKTTEANQWLEIARRRLTVRQRLVLDKVCIEDKLIWTVAKEMKAGRPSIARALRGGLVQVVRNHKSAAEEARRRGLVSSAQKVKIGAEIVRLVR